ncbi:ATP-binding protein [Guptibacillus algicola]|uniref:ATP-binding protein n=1 Tax=Guptibacillus algicola TaxID=225844 RepID=UPI001CD7784E|nr:AAA family ATPase [Alkalihalobacillus algicola]MCA0989201.1 AAA family ATPase [Alkalihalobacillus algicola]
MKLLGWHIYRFGKFEDYKVTSLSDQLQTIYGENEAGKSTIIAFIESILFGFTMKKEESYVLKKHSRTGGSLLFDVDGNSVTIERTRGKASGDVVVHYHDGSTGDEDDLTRMLKGMDRKTFRQLFFCNLNTLYDYTDHTEDSWNSILYEAGMTGGASLLTIEKELEKRQSELFKPGGRKPIINAKLEEWESTKKSVRELEKVNSTYNDTVEKVEALKKVIEDNKVELTSLQHKRRELDYEKTIFPLIKERTKLERQLESLPAYNPFPEDGLSQLDKWKERVVISTGEINHSQIEQDDIKKEINQQEIHDHRNVIQKVNYWNEQVIVYRTKREEKKRLEREKQELFNNLQVRLKEVDLSDHQLEKMVTSFNAKKELKDLVESYQRSNQQYDYLNESLLAAREELEREEDEYNRLQERRRSQASDGGTARKPKLQSSVIMFCISIVLLFGIGILEDWFLALGVAGIVVIGALVMRMTNEKYTSTAERLSAEKYELNRQAQNMQEQIDRLNRTYTKAAEKVDQWELERFKLEESLEKWKISYSFKTDVSPERMLELFDRVVVIKQLEQDYKGIERQLVELDYEMRVVEDGIKKLCEEVDVSYYDVETALQQLILLADEQKELMQHIERMKDRLTTIERKEKDEQAKLRSFENQIDQLLLDAEVQTEEEFRIKGNAQSEAKELLRQKVIVDSQLEGTGEVTINHASLKEIEEEKARVENEEGSLMKEQQKLYREIANHQEQLRALTEDGTLEDLLLQSQQKEDELHSFGRKWAVLKVASDLLLKAKAKYQDERLPAVLQSAERYFSTITEGRYTAIYAPKEKSSFQIHHQDGSVYLPSQLSRGTVEQLYLCIRLALVSVTSIKLPVILDDIFVNFDEKRTEVAKGFIKDYSKEHQVLLLTCHQSALPCVDENIIKLERTPLSGKVN